MALEVFTRTICFIVFSIIIYLFEDGMALQQLRVLVLLWFNNLLHTMSVGIGPVKTFVLLYIITSRPFDSLRI